MNEDKGFDGEVGERYIGIAERREKRTNMQNEEITFQSQEIKRRFTAAEAADSRMRQSNAQMQMRRP